MPIAPLHPRFAARVFGLLAPALLAAMLLIPACARDESKVAPQAKPAIRVVCTISVLTDAAFHVGYPRAEVVGLINGPSNAHSFEPSDQQLTLSSDADVVLALGLDLERRTLPLLAMAREGKSPVVSIGDALDGSLLIFPPDLGGKPDPHVWFDASLWARAVLVVRDALIRADPDGRALYEKNAESYAAKIEKLHRQTVRGAATVPSPHRVIVSSHASFAYFGRAYGFETFGLEGVNGDAPMSASEIERVADLVAARGLPVIYVDIHTPGESIERLAELALSRGHKVQISGPLYGSSTSEEGRSESTYQGMFVHNLGHIFTELGGTLGGKDE